MPAVPSFWWKARRNFGDRLTPLLVSYFAGFDTCWSMPADAQLLCSGSILEHYGPYGIPNNWDGIILGSGKLHNRPISLPNATVLAVRGPLTAMDFKGDFALGDPGLLADGLVDIETKNYDLGIIPHWSDTKLATCPTFLPYDPLIIDPRGDVLCILQMIGQCRKIVSSSLHGIILADAFSIPRRFEYTSQFDKEGGMFKFEDYSASINTPLKVGVTQIANRFMIENRQNELHDAFDKFASMIL